MLTILAISCLTAIITYFLWYRKSIKYRTGNFPSPPGHFLIGHAPYLSTTDKVIPYTHEKLLENDGFIKLHIGTRPVLYVSNREFVKWLLNSPVHSSKIDEYRFMKGWLGNGLLLAQGAHWRLRRKMLTPAFHFKMIENHIHCLHNTISILIEQFRKNIKKSEFDIYPLITSFTLDAVCESTMACPIKAQEGDQMGYKESIRHLCRILCERFTSPFKRFDFLFQFYPDQKISEKSIASINSFTTTVMKNRRILINSEQTEPEKEEEEQIENKYERVKKTPFIDLLLRATDDNNQSLSDQDILDEVNTFIFGGYETIASAISFTIYNLAQHPDIQNRAFEEQKLLFGSERNPAMTLSILNEMKYLDLVIKESLRLHTTIPMIGRKIEQDSYYNGKLLPAGLTIVICLYTLHNDPKLFPEPEKFDPSRFEDDKNLPFSFLPFSAGQRNCIGQKFAMNQLKQVISSILRNFELISIPNRSLKLVEELSLKSSNGIWIKLKERKY